MRTKCLVARSSPVSSRPGGALCRLGRVVCLLALSLVVAGCGTVAPGPTLSAVVPSQVSPVPRPPSELTPSAVAPSQVSPLPTPALQPSPSAFAPSQVSPLPTPVLQPSPSAVVPSQVSPLPTPTPEPAAAPAPNQLLVLHTNDNWGATEPCG
jgi:hypothetical protein